LRDLREAFEGIEDKRFEPYVGHLLSDIVMITLIGVLVSAYSMDRGLGLSEVAISAAAS
jgi:hypothetical protein